MKVFEIDIVVTHKMRYIADDAYTAHLCAEFDYMNQFRDGDLWLCNDVQSNWDTHFVEMSGKQKIKGKLPPRNAKEYDLENFKLEYGETK